MKISIVTSLYRSAPYLQEFCERAIRATREIDIQDYEVILVNDNSPDDDLMIARRLADTDAHIVVIDLSRNFGQHSALVTGLQYATGDLIYVLDSDLEEEPEWLINFQGEMKRTDCDVVYGVQVGTKGTASYRLGRKLFYVLLNWLSGVKFPENIVTARLMTRRYVNAMLDYKEREMFLAGIWHMVGFAQLPVSVVKLHRSSTTYTISRLIYLFVNGVTSFSTRPLAAIAITGISLSLVALVFILWVVLRQFLYGVGISGWASVMAGVLAVGGISMFFNGVMALYIAKIFLEVKKRPLSTVREVYRSGNEPVRLDGSTEPS